MASIIAAIITGVVTGALSLIGILTSNSKSLAVMAEKIDELSKRVEKHNNMIERTYKLESDMAVIKNDIVTLYKKTE